ncbi:MULTISPECIES: BlaI/MecI/CopY family transcriptional regulator [Paenibacillus]|uniref:BlaI/MecI/CopY family transcriptional regulator n=1 Tax=Paenibacillus anseongense TaxID=2682845 RepID=A0ABW9U519_9BACL|nr:MULTISPECIES: BlaI/MecI/CopY family transcriptional regulator [Paenibacillus]MBA2937093.1 BlaI/MecI/CopY family transcriptional regulator [Paenibacillus sp. CGMCC 1.16610]MVQ33415.1 BlaI/MecI/CopY family transcriptional regulator [Paenibacillus anseongense]
MKKIGYRMQEEGVSRFLGSLETLIMELMWDSGDWLNVQQLRESLKSEHDYSVTTIMTVLNRLSEKGLLVKMASGRGRNKLAQFKVVTTREDFILEQTRNVTEGLIKDFGEVVVAHMIDVMEEIDPHLLKKVEHMLQEAKMRNSDEENKSS